MIRVCFVCLGNICRSPMAEFIFKDLVKKEGLENEFLVESRGTCDDEIGNDIHPGTKSILDKHNIPYTRHYATRLLKSDYEKFDYFIGMDNYNVLSMKKLFGTDKKVYKLLDFTKHSKEIDDPWYTHNFTITYEEVDKGCRALLKYIESKYK
ncbi:MAG TPA: low molecular weight phosphotyrosine protein phosphatase [Candidatus Onthousia excrementipullorum]|uniref:protein-tyrosine-phosphatase n=1 Tax=Candidatus Onthousia excrementipullorum TaxID=2840884 RepID=A0A9D1J3N7_9FIRM|nr:low molecular weight phosphotyrosine protein phosphatase [Candidatus Onthousia excrementipullorum]